MPTAEYTCRMCGGEREDNLWAITTHGPRMPLLYCPQCRAALSDTEGQDDPQTHGTRMSERVCAHCDKPYVPRKPWQKYCRNACRWAAWHRESK